MSKIFNINKEFVTETLHSDALFTSLLIDKEYNTKLFDEAILTLDPNTMYSTTDCSDKFFHIANSTLRYYVRMLEGYLEIFVEGRKKRLPFLSVFKIHMVLLAIERGETISDIQVKLGMKSIPQQSAGKAKGNKYNDEVLDQLLAEFERRQNVILNTNMLQTSIGQIELELLKKTTSISDRKRQIEIIEEKVINHRLFRKMDRQAGNVLKKSVELNKKTSFFSMFTKKAAQDLQALLAEIQVNENEVTPDTLEVNLKEQIGTLKQEISEIETEVYALEKRLAKETARLTNERVLLQQTMED